MQNSIPVFRAKLNITQEDLANRVGVTRQTIIAIEKNRYYPSLELAFKMAALFGCTIEDIFQYERRGE
jgi:putative transcriptional regulator